MSSKNIFSSIDDLDGIIGLISIKTGGLPKRTWLEDFRGKKITSKFKVNLSLSYQVGPYIILSTSKGFYVLNVNNVDVIYKSNQNNIVDILKISSDAYAIKVCNKSGNVIQSMLYNEFGDELNKDISRFVNLSKI